MPATASPDAAENRHAADTRRRHIVWMGTRVVLVARVEPRTWEIRYFSLVAEGIIRGVEIAVTSTKTAETSGTSIAFEHQPDTRRLLEAHVAAAGLSASDQLFQPLRRTRARQGLSERAYAMIVKKWVEAIGLNPLLYGTHSIRRSRRAYTYQQTANIRVCQLMLGHSSVSTTQEYLGIAEAETLEVSRLYRM